jgi:hypothetical protein
MEKNSGQKSRATVPLKWQRREICNLRFFNEKFEFGFSFMEIIWLFEKLLAFSSQILPLQNAAENKISPSYI